MKQIPDFIDTRFEDHYTVYQNIVNILKLFNICMVTEMFSDKGIEELSNHYYTSLLSIHNENKDLYKSSLGYITDIYDEFIEYLNANELYEASYNLSKMVKI